MNWVKIGIWLWWVNVIVGTANAFIGMLTKNYGLLISGIAIATLGIWASNEVIKLGKWLEEIDNGKS